MIPAAPAAQPLIGAPHTGFIAQQPIFPDLVSQGPDGYLLATWFDTILPTWHLIWPATVRILPSFQEL